MIHFFPAATIKATSSRVAHPRGLVPSVMPAALACFSFSAAHGQFVPRRLGGGQLLPDDGPHLLLCQIVFASP